MCPPEAATALSLMTLITRCYQFKKQNKAWKRTVNALGPSHSLMFFDLIVRKKTNHHNCQTGIYHQSLANWLNLCR